MYYWVTYYETYRKIKFELMLMVQRCTSDSRTLFFSGSFLFGVFVQWSLGVVVLLFSVVFSVYGVFSLVLWPFDFPWLTIILHYLMWFPRTCHEFPFQMYHTWARVVNESWCKWYCQTIELGYSDTMSLWYSDTVRLWDSDTQRLLYYDSLILWSYETMRLSLYETMIFWY